MFSRSCCQQIAQFFSTGAVSASFQFFDKFDILVVMNRPIRISICPRNERKKRRQRERARESERVRMRKGLFWLRASERDIGTEERQNEWTSSGGCKQKQEQELGGSTFPGLGSNLFTEKTNK